MPVVDPMTAATAQPWDAELVCAAVVDLEPILVEADAQPFAAQA
jgi:hypothetical protein